MPLVLLKAPTTWSGKVKVTALPLDWVKVPVKMWVQVEVFMSVSAMVKVPEAMVMPLPVTVTGRVKVTSSEMLKEEVLVSKAMVTLPGEMTVLPNLTVPGKRVDLTAMLVMVKVLAESS